MKTNLKTSTSTSTSISISVSGIFVAPDSCDDSLSFFDSLSQYSCWTPSFFRYSFDTKSSSIKAMLNEIFEYDSCFLSRLSAVSRLYSSFFSRDTNFVDKKLYVTINYMNNSYIFDIPFSHFYMFFESFNSCRTSANILDTFNYYALKYPHVK